MDTKTKSTADMTTLPVERVAGDAIRAFADTNGFKLIRFVGALANGWRLLTAEQQRMAMRSDFEDLVAAQPTTAQQESNGSPESVLTADPPAQQVSNMQSQDDADSSSPPVSNEPQSNANSSETRAKAS